MLNVSMTEKDEITMVSIQKHTSYHYLIALFILAFYGVQVCPFLESLSVWQLTTPIAIVFLLQWLLRYKLETAIHHRDFKHQVALQFKTDLGLFLLSGILLAAFNAIAFDIPAVSGGKILIGMAVLGYLSACQLSLTREYQIANILTEQGLHLTPDATPFPLTRKFNLFAVICAIALIGVVFLVINKDLEWLAEPGNNIPIETAQRYILSEIIFVVAIIMTYVLLIIMGYSRNLKLFINNEQQTLELVAQGNLNVRVPVTSNDEFGLMALHTNTMISSLAKKTQELNTTRDASILGLASLAETRDNETGGHILRTQNYVKALANEMARSEKYKASLSPEIIDLIYKSAPLHDVGKVGIPDNILLKPGKLTETEFKIMKNHAQIGADALAVAEHQLGSNSFLKYAKEISLAHHEKWDGSGYPNQLTGENIPLSGRLMALADVYDALISKRIYKPAFSHGKARSIIIEGKGSHFDPAVVDAFISIEGTFIAIAKEFSDRIKE